MSQKLKLKKKTTFSHIIKEKVGDMVEDVEIKVPIFSKQVNKMVIIQVPVTNVALNVLPSILLYYATKSYADVGSMVVVAETSQKIKHLFRSP